MEAFPLIEYEPIIKPDYEIRTTCRACDTPDLKDVLSLGEHRVVGWGETLPPKVPLELVACPKCDLLQLRHTTRPDLLWGDDYGYRSGVNETMRKELTEIAHEAEQRVHFREKDLVVDIGCNDGTLLSAYTKPFQRVGFDPSVNMAKFAKEAGHEVVFDYFSADKFRFRNAKIITAISMFYDLDDPNKFLEDVRHCMTFDGIFVVQQNYLKGMMDNLAYDNICHEHLTYYSLRTLRSLFERHLLDICDVSEDGINGGSFRVYAKHRASPINIDGGDQRVQDMLGREVEAKMGWQDLSNTYKIFAEKVKHQGDYLKAFIEQKITAGKRIYVYGASTRGGTLLQFCRIDSRQIVAAAERNPDKWGKVMQSTGIPIVSEDEARANADYLLVLPWFFKKEFVEREKEFVKKGGHLIFPLPRFEVI